MTNQPHIIATALLLMAAFLIGCLVGRNLHRLFGSKPVGQDRTIVEADVPKEVKEQAPELNKSPSKTSAVAENGQATGKTTMTAATTKPQPAKKFAPKGKTSGKPATLSKARAEGKDNLKLIKGIGPKLEEILNTLGIYHFDQVASWDKESVAWIDQELSFKGRIDRENWISQAKEILKNK